MLNNRLSIDVFGRDEFLGKEIVKMLKNQFLIND